jgi:hypothetical protein
MHSYIAMSSAPSYSDRARVGLAYLFRRFNDIDIYVEDVAAEKVWTAIAQRVLGHKAKVTKVHALGGRGKVVEACRSSQHVVGRARLYIIDGDLNLVTGQLPPALDDLYQLGVYCCENLLVDESTVLDVADETCPDMKMPELGTALDIGGALTGLARDVRGLFVLFAVAFHLGSEQRTVGQKVHSLCNRSSGQGILELSGTKIAQRSTQLREALVTEFGQSLVSATESTMDGLFPKDPARAIDFISGKTYVLPLVHDRVVKIAGLKYDERQFMIRLAHKYDEDREPGLKRAILSACTSGR